MRKRWTAAVAALAPILLGACGDEPTSPTGPAPAALFSCLFGEALELEVGEVVRFTGEAAQTICLDGAANGAEYLYVPFNASDEGVTTLRVELTGGGIQSPAGPPFPAREPLPNAGFHAALRQRETAELEPRMSAARASRPSLSRASAVEPIVGQLVQLNTTTDCTDIDLHTGRVEAVSSSAIIVADTSNPVGGFTQEDWQFFAEVFDTLVNPVATRNFGEPTDIDGNGRVIIFFTEAVNELTPPGSGVFVGGFFWAGDLFPRSVCPGSNTAEMFYMLVPDPERAALGEGAFEPSFVKRITTGTIGHEYQHLINASRRIYINEADALEEVWLNEGLSHIAEELLFYHVTPFEPRQNLGLDEVRQVLPAFFAYAVSNFGRFLQYLENPDEESLLGQDNLPTRGASWAFLRYAADHEAGPDADFFRALVDGPESGVENLRNVLADPITAMQSWTVSVYTDDAPIPVEPIYTQPSWNFRSIMPALADTEEYPLEVIRPQPGVERALTLQGGGAAFVRFGVTLGGRAVLHTTSAGVVPPERLRISILRTK